MSNNKTEEGEIIKKKKIKMKLKKMSKIKKA